MSTIPNALNVLSAESLVPSSLSPVLDQSATPSELTSLASSNAMLAEVDTLFGTSAPAELPYGAFAPPDTVSLSSSGASDPVPTTGVSTPPSLSAPPANGIDMYA